MYQITRKQYDEIKNLHRMQQIFEVRRVFNLNPDDNHELEISKQLLTEIREGSGTMIEIIEDTPQNNPTPDKPDNMTSLQQLLQSVGLPPGEPSPRSSDYSYLSDMDMCRSCHKMRPLNQWELCAECEASFDDPNSAESIDEW